MKATRIMGRWYVVTWSHFDRTGTRTYCCAWTQASSKFDAVMKTIDHLITLNKENHDV